MKQYVQHLPQTAPIVLAGDHTAWSRPHAVTLKDRTYEHQAQPLSGSKPVTVGQGYSTLAWIPESQGSWALPLLHERMSSFDNPIGKAVAQLKQVCEHLPSRALTLWDAEYGCARFILETATIACDKLLRVRPNRVLYAPPPPYSGKGRPRKHGPKFNLKDATTWWQPDQALEHTDEALGRLRLRVWHNLHFSRSAAHAMHLLQVERLDEVGTPTAKPLWLIWVGQTLPPLATLAPKYLRRFAIDHWYRFLKQRLHWTLPRFPTPEPAQSWSDLMPLLTWQLWFARSIVCDSPLPWQKKLPKLSPGRVAFAFASVLAAIGSPATDPKPRGNSPGWQPGRSRTRRTRYPVVKKGFARPRQPHRKSA